MNECRAVGQARAMGRGFYCPLYTSPTVCFGSTGAQVLAPSPSNGPDLIGAGSPVLKRRQIIQLGNLEHARKCAFARVATNLATTIPLNTVYLRRRGCL